MPEIHSIKHKKTGTVYGIADDVVREQLAERNGSSATNTTPI